MISENVAANPTESPPENDPWPAIMADPQLANARRKLSIHELRLIIAHARRTADAPEIAAAEIRGLEMAKEIGLSNFPFGTCDFLVNGKLLGSKNGETLFVEAKALEKSVYERRAVIDARIAELKAKTEP